MNVTLGCERRKCRLEVNAMSKLKPTTTGSGMVCDVNTGICAPADLAPEADWELIYVGDPTCSACWAIAPTVSELPGWAASQGAKFSVLAGAIGRAHV